jgi:translation initiation factor IF-2
MMVSINQRLDAETLAVIAEEYGFKVEFVGADVQETMQEEDDDPGAHGSTCAHRHRHGPRGPRQDLVAGLCPQANVIAGEAGGITQHIGAYSVTWTTASASPSWIRPGHEAFTAMRARGAQVTDIAIIVIARTTA